MTSTHQHISSHSEQSHRAQNRPVLIVAHREHPAPGYVELALKQLDIPMDVCRPCMGEALPNTLERHAGVIVLGGFMSANDNLEYIRRELTWLAVPLKENKPYFGICLGAQLLAKHLGATVRPCERGSAEIGYYPQRSLGILQPPIELPRQVCQWHREGFELPDGAELLCEGLGAFKNQAYRYGDNAYGIQFHPEVTYRLLKTWLTTEPEALELPGAQEPQAIMDAHLREARSVRNWLKNFIAHWLTGQCANVGQASSASSQV